MAERRRLLIDSSRLQSARACRRFELEDHEVRYLRKVLRLRAGAEVDVVDGCGRLWSACVVSGSQLELTTEFSRPIQRIPAPRPQLGLAIALIRRGMDDVARMACELGVDRLQFIQAERSVAQAEYRPDRWESIVREAVEQCERLWRPELCALCASSDWWGGPAVNDLRLIAVTRDRGIPHLQTLLAAKPVDIGRVWLAIGPEGGWTAGELEAARDAGWSAVALGDTIQRSSTAAVAGVASLCHWRLLHGCRDG